jgi:hypothetical protein
MPLVGSLILFLFAAVSLAYIPGRLALRFGRLSVAGLDSISLSLNLGLVISAIVFWLLSYFSVQQYFILYALAGVGIFLYHWRKGWERPRLSIEGPHLLLVGMILLGVLLLAILPMYYSNMTLTPDGRMRFWKGADPFLHTGIANELTHAVPPQNPVFSGQPLSYHVGVDLPAAMVANIAGISVADLTVRFVPTLFLIITILSVFCFAREWLFSGYGAALVTWLMFFGEDFSFIPGLLQGSKLDWSVQYFSAPSTFSLFLVNPIVPALGLLFAVLLCLAKAFRDHQFKWQLVAGLLFAGLAECKILTGGHFGISLALAGVFYFIVFRSPGMLQATIVAGCFSLPIAAGAFLLNRHSAQYSVTFFQSEWIRDMVEQLGLTSQLASLPPPAWFAIAVPIYLIGSMGLRAIAIPALLKDLLWPRNDTPLRFLLAIFIVVGAVLGLTVTLVPKGLPENYNNAIWLYGQSKCVAWLFAVETAQRLLRTRMPSIAQWACFAALAVAVSVPSTIQHFTKVTSRSRSVLLSSATVEVLEFLRTTALPGEAVLSPPQLIGPILAKTKCHVPVGPYAENSVPFAQFQRRTADIASFWRAWHGGSANVQILQNYGVSYLVINKQRDFRPNVIPELTVIFENTEWLVYRVTPNQQPRRASSKQPSFSGSDESVQNVSSLTLATFNISAGLNQVLRAVMRQDELLIGRGWELPCPVNSTFLVGS